VKLNREIIGMLDLQSAVQFVGLMLVARVLAYLIVRLIEKIKPRPVHFIIAAAIKRSSESQPAQKETEIEATKRLRLNNSRKYPELGKQFLKIVWRNFYYYRLNFINRVRLRRHDVNKRFSLKLLTEVTGLLTAGISLVALVLDRLLK
jgi:hypothetical protein